MPPEDLVSLATAATMAERSERTIRRWIDADKITRHEGTPPDTGGPAPVLVSRSELLKVLAITGQAPRPAHPDNDLDTLTDTPPGIVDTVQVDEVAKLRAELAAMRIGAKVDTLTAELEHARTEIEHRDRELRRLREELAIARADLVDWRERHDAREAELRAMRTQQGVSWWRRMLGGPVLELEGGEA